MLFLGVTPFGISQNTSDLDNITTFTDYKNYTFVEIEDVKYFIGSADSFIESVNFKLNKRGGDNSVVEFARSIYNFKAGLSVKFVIENEVIYLGYIDLIENEDKTLNILPTWSKLRNVIVTNELVPSGDYRIIDIVNYLKSFIENAGISIGTVEILDTLTINYKLYGQNIETVLNDLEESMPSSYVWGVNELNQFYFYQLQPVRNPQRISYDLNDFAKTSFTQDYSEIYSQSIVKIKATDIDGKEYQKIIGIVGMGDITYENVTYKQYPFLSWYKEVGIKQSVFELSFKVDPVYAFDSAYRVLQLQEIPEKIEVSEVNLNNFIPKYNKYYKIIMNPQNGLNVEVVPGVADEGTSTILKSAGYVDICGNPYGLGLEENTSELIFNENVKYLNACDMSTSIDFLTIKYVDSALNTKFRLSDGNTTFEFIGQNNIVRVDLTEIYFDKYDLVLEVISDDKAFSYININVNFRIGSKTRTMLCRTAEIKYSRSIFSGSMELSNLNTRLNGTLFNDRKKINTIESILSSHTGE